MNDWTRRAWGPLQAWGAEAPEVLLLPGAGGQASLFREVTSSLGCAAAAVDLPGHGDHPGPLLRSIEEMALAVESAVRALGRPVFLLGHSMGGAVVLETALRGGVPLKGIILYSTGARLRVSPMIFEGLEKHYDVRTRESVRLFFGQKAPPEVLDAYLALPQHPTNEVAIVDFRATDRFDRMADTGRVAVPALVIGGDDDALTPAKYQAFLAEKIPGAARVILPGAGHMAHLEAPAGFRAAIEQFVHTSTSV